MLRKIPKKITNPKNRKIVILSIVLTVIIPSIAPTIITQYLQNQSDISQDQQLDGLEYRVSVLETFHNKDEEELFNKGWEALLNEKYLDASELFQQVYDINSNNIDAINNKGVALALLGHPDKAIPLFRQFLEQSPDDPDGLANLATALFKNNNFEESIIYYEKALKYASIKNDDRYWINYGLSLNNVGRPAEAVNAYFQALKINENNISALNNFANIIGVSGAHLDAIRYYDKIIELNPNYILAYNNKGWNLERLGFFQRAIDEYNKALELDDNNPDAQYNKAQALEKIIKFGEFKQQQRYHITEVISVDPSQNSESRMTCNSSDLSTAIKIESTSDKLAVSHNRENDFEWKVSFKNTDDVEHSITIEIECIKKLS